MYNLTSKLDKLLSQTATTLAFIVEHINASIHCYFGSYHNHADLFPT